jgi:DnaJ-class molecular chaperone
MENPYDVLGLGEGATLTEVKAQYIKLAKIHHPDKLSPELSAGEREHHEELFKKITVSYRYIQDSHTRGRGGGGGFWWNEQSGGAAATDWTAMWRQVFQETMAEVKKRYHSVKMPVSLEDVHKKKVRKLEIFLRDVSEPVYIKVNCGLYPKTTVIHGGLMIKIRFILQDHPTYYLDNLLGTQDLYTSCDVYLTEYLRGITMKLPYLDGTEIQVIVPPFVELEKPIVCEGKGLWEAGDLFVKLRLVSPDREAWKSLNEDVRKNILDGLDAARLPIRDDARAGDLKTI